MSSLKVVGSQASVPLKAANPPGALSRSDRLKVHGYKSRVDLSKPGQSLPGVLVTVVELLSDSYRRLLRIPQQTVWPIRVSFGNQSKSKPYLMSKRYGILQGRSFAGPSPALRVQPLPPTSKHDSSRVPRGYRRRSLGELHVHTDTRWGPLIQQQLRVDP